MLDLHCHILPNIDDGARSWDDSLLIAQKAVDEGITHLLATPHHLNGKYVNKKANVVQLTNQLQERLDQANIPLQVFPSQEVRVSGEILAGVDADEILGIDEDNRYLLVEFPTREIPHFVEQLFFNLQQRGITPVIVHPERNQAIIVNPNLLLPFIECGALAQVTASSYVGIFGKDIAKLSHQLIDANLVHIMASDAHNTRGRSFHMREAFEKIEEEFGQEKALLFKNNAKNIINGDLFTPETPREIKKKKKFFGLF